MCQGQGAERIVKYELFTAYCQTLLLDKQYEKSLS